jgi:NAD(P)-dependent dehydrogenase (short-subunit alcohol dehydrogenase family)
MSPPRIDLSRSVVAVTGGARGIGRATALAFAARGARLAVGDLHAEAAREVCAEIGGPARASAHLLDVSDAASFAAFLDAAEQAHGAPVEVLVNNAGVMPIGPFLRESDSAAATQMNVNFWGVYNGMRLAGSRMTVRGRGHIVNVTSGAGKTLLPGLAVYVASKHAATALSRVVREELWGQGVSVTAVLPIAVNTQLTDGIPIERLPFGLERVGVVEPEDVAEAVVRTVDTRPAMVGVPRWLVPAMNALELVPEPVMRAMRGLLVSGITMGEIDRAARAEYDGRIEEQAR